MKKNFKYAMMSAIAFVGAVSFSACQSGDEVVVDPNPTFDGESVKTQFTISLPDNIRTRMASTTVQETGFRGIDNIKLVPYSLASGDVLVGSEANDDLISLSAISGFDYANSNSKVYADVNLKVSTSNFLFYGKAVDNAAGTAIETADDKFKFGTLEVKNLTGKPNLSSVEFAPVSIYADATAEGKAVGDYLIAVLNAVVNATPKEYDGSQFVNATLSDNSAPKFKEVSSELTSSIHNLFLAFKNLSVSSSKNVELALLDLCQNLDGCSTAAAKTTAPNTYKMAIGIRAAIAEYATVTVNSGVTTKVELKTDLANAITGYPANINLPDGAARVAYNSTNGAFEAATNVYYSAMNVASLERYAYPANLQYYVNSSLKVSNSVQSINYGTKAWAGEGGVLDLYTNGTAVTGNTRSVAIVNPIQYGVARLDATVAGLSSEDGAVYKDYNGTAVNVAEGFELTGILVGGQKSVGWNYLPKTETEYTIYDKTLNTGHSVVKKGIASAINYTLVLQSTDNETVNVALEFVNKGEEFVGLNGEIIHKGATFYLVGALNPTEGTKQEGAIDDVTKRVFTQDCKTIVTFTIKQGTGNDGSGSNPEEGLGTATKGLPDLRTPHMELGLSVNLEWSPGLTFNVTF